MFDAMTTPASEEMQLVNEKEDKRLEIASIISIVSEENEREIRPAKRKKVDPHIASLSTVPIQSRRAELRRKREIGVK